MESSARICPKCGASDWTTRNRCNPCDAAKARAKWAADPEAARAKDREKHRRWRAANPAKSRAQDLRARYRIDEGGIARLLENQEARCAICGGAGPDCIDHCHRSGKVRGVLCRRCNAGLGQFRDDPALVLAAVAYLESMEDE